MLVFSYILLVFALGLIVYGLVVRARGIKAVPFYKEDPNVADKRG